jgi:predicted mannosyl-3-phosphoglycerate phosphatase (HAD superfamily)
MSHPLYNNPEYVKATKDHEYAVAVLKKAQAEEHALWKKILKMEEDYKAMQKAEYSITAEASDQSY